MTLDGESMVGQVNPRVRTMPESFPHPTMAVELNPRPLPCALLASHPGPAGYWGGCLPTVRRGRGLHFVHVTEGTLS